MKSQSIAALSIAALAALALAGCGSGDDSGASASASETTSAAAETSAATTGGEPITLTFQALWDQPAAIDVMNEIVDSWNTSHPDVQVQVVQAGWDGVYDKLVTSFAGGTAPDIIHYEAAAIGTFASDGYLADLTDEIPADLKSDISQGIWDTVTTNDQIVAVPLDMQSYMVFANKTLLDAAGVTIPTGDTMTWDEFEQIAKATTSGDVYGVTWGLKSPTATMMNLGLNFDGTFFDGSGTDATIHVGDNEVEVPKRIHDMAYTDKSLDPVSLTQSGSEVLASFYGGKAAMTVQGSYQVANIAADAPEGFDWVVLPPLEGTAGAEQGANPQTLSVNVDSKHVKEAAEFCAYFASTENLAKIAQADVLIPASTSAQEELATMTAGETGWDQVLVSGKDLVKAPFLTVDGYADWKDTVATPAFQQYLADQISLNDLKTQLESGWSN